MLSKATLIDNYDLSSVKCFVSGAAPLSSEVIQYLIHKFGCEFLQGYGMTECAGSTQIVPRGQSKLMHKNGTVGIKQRTHLDIFIDLNFLIKGSRPF